MPDTDTQPKAATAPKARKAAAAQEAAEAPAAPVEPQVPEAPPGVWTPERQAALQAPFSEGQTEWLPKQLRREDQDKGKCETPRQGVCADDHPCGGWHARSVHLTYVGHAGITDRLLSVDPTWDWEPVATREDGTPLPTDDGLWIRLTVLGITRLGYGDAQGKRGSNAVKETIGDAIRNAAMRFGVGTYLWSKSADSQILKAGGELQDQQAPQQRQQQAQQRPQGQQGGQRMADVRQGVQQAQEPRTDAERAAAPRPVHNVQRIFAAMQGLSAEARRDVEGMTREQWGPDWTPAKSTDDQADAVVAMAESWKRSDSDGSAEDVPPPPDTDAGGDRPPY